MAARKWSQKFCTRMRPTRIQQGVGSEEGIETQRKGQKKFNYQEAKIVGRRIGPAVTPQRN